MKKRTRIEGGKVVTRDRTIELQGSSKKALLSQKEVILHNGRKLVIMTNMHFTMKREGY